PLADWTSSPGNQSTHRRDYIGQILQLDPEGERVTVRLESGGIREGQPLFAESPELGFLEMTPEDIELEGHAVTRADKGCIVTLPRQSFMHKGLKLYQLSQR